MAAARGESPDELGPYEQAFAAIEADPYQFLACLEGPDGALVGTLQHTVIPA